MKGSAAALLVALVLVAPSAPALWLEDATHSWELLSGELSAFGVEPKAAAQR